MFFATSSIRMKSYLPLLFIKFSSLFFLFLINRKEMSVAKQRKCFTRGQADLVRDLYRKFENGSFMALLTEGATDKNAEKGAAWNRFTETYKQVPVQFE